MLRMNMGNTHLLKLAIVGFNVLVVQVDELISITLDCNDGDILADMKVVSKRLSVVTINHHHDRCRVMKLHWS